MNNNQKGEEGKGITDQTEIEANEIFEQVRPEIDQHLKNYFEQIDQQVTNILNQYLNVTNQQIELDLDIKWIQTITQQVLIPKLNELALMFEKQFSEGIQYIHQIINQQDYEMGTNIKKYYNQFEQLLKDLVYQIQYANKSEDNLRWFEKYKKTYLKRLNAVKQINEKFFQEKKGLQKLKRIEMVYKNIQRLMQFVNLYQPQIENSQKLVKRLAKIYQIDFNTPVKQILKNSLKSEREKQQNKFSSI